MGQALALVVPVLNERAELEPLCSQLADAARSCEVVVVDGGSDDGSGRVLRERAARHGFRVIESARGRARQMNAGARATQAGTLLFLHADTRLPEGALAAALREVGTGAIGGCFKLSIASPDPRLRAAAGLINLRSRVLCSATGDQAIFVERGTFERVGGFRELPLCEDLDFVHRLCGKGRFALVDLHVQTSARRWEQRGVLRTIGLMWGLRIGWHLGVAPETLGKLYRQNVR